MKKLLIGLLVLSCSYSFASSKTFNKPTVEGKSINMNSALNYCFSRSYDDYKNLFTQFTSHKKVVEIDEAGKVIDTTNGRSWVHYIHSVTCVRL